MDAGDAQPDLKKQKMSTDVETPAPTTKTLAKNVNSFDVAEEWRQNLRCAAHCDHSLPSAPATGRQRHRHRPGDACQPAWGPLAAPTLPPCLAHSINTHDNPRVQPGSARADRFCSMWLPSSPAPNTTRTCTCRGDTELVSGPKGERPDWWWTGPKPEAGAAGIQHDGTVTSLPLPNLATCTREQVGRKGGPQGCRCVCMACWHPQP
jgi:hypothetical protein